MSKFPWVPATQKNYNMRKKIYGKGVNDAPYVTQPTVNGKTVRCPYHRIWYNMLQRALDPVFKAKHPHYEDVGVCDDWLHFMEFRGWAEHKYRKGLELDKDLLVPGNRVYRPEACAFVTQKTNSLIFCSVTNPTDSYGVDKNMGLWRAQLQGKLIGRYSTKKEAVQAQRAAKAYELIKQSFLERDNAVCAALLKRASDLLLQRINEG